MKRFLSLLAALTMMSSFAGCCCTQGCGGGGWNQGSYYQPNNYAPNYAPAYGGGCANGQCGVPQPVYPQQGFPQQGQMYGPTTALPQAPLNPVAAYPYAPQTAFAPGLQGIPPL